MKKDQNLPLEDSSSSLQAVSNAVREAVTACQGETKNFLNLLRQLEYLHKEIRDGVFQDSLPENRQELYNLLKDIESTGGWPYIERMRLQWFLINLATKRNEYDAEIEISHP
ncbi:hypothetical protein B7O87_02820 [Cylindrospermopsis raciborskii CENA303]|uniref:Uncharacterized protein n=1 Tax=Cylindrospermopsis raciborskii CENA303 TaxID=1170769 RepID=A0A1X4GBC4_9CYAN|nr:hypothetical protein [Cylindrospermopsis raciborskii]EFA73186.1 conserved hypothetical protein [Raphidiopsis brookii D9]OSO94494.1 hypothetical protein B7O87_02820 [Cylindrospermopsis raciborskii CENA303]